MSLSCQRAVNEPDLLGAAETVSANAFLNALLRETRGWRVFETAAQGAPPLVPLPAVRYPLTSGALWFPLRYRSACGRHLFTLPLWFEREDLGLETCGLLQVAQRLVQEPDLFPAADAASRARFLQRVAGSVDNLHEALLARWPDLPQLFAAPLDFVRAEQALLAGHAMHPTPKSRDPFAREDALRYAPEHGQDFALTWVAMARTQLGGESADPRSLSAYTRVLFTCDLQGQAAPRLLAGEEPLPMHPWQWQRLRTHPGIAPLLRSGRIRELGTIGGAWRATSSLRAIHAAHAPYMLKFSLNLRLTNSLRVLQPQELQRGLELHRVMQTQIGRELRFRCPQFSILSEPAYLCLRDAQGQPVAESVMLLRQNPFRGESAENHCLLATLTQDDPLGGDARVARLIRQLAARRRLSLRAAASTWFEHFLDVAVEPLVLAQADYGLLLGAHQQNLILRFNGPQPVGAYFRDCQGTGYSPLAHRLFAAVMPSLGAAGENLLDGARGNHLFSYYLLVNSCFALISAIAAAGLIDESTLLRQLRRRLLRLRGAEPRDPSWLDEVLSAPLLYAKRNFECAFRGINDTTAPDPFALYHSLPNPLASL